MGSHDRKTANEQKLFGGSEQTYDYRHYGHDELIHRWIAGAFIIARGEREQAADILFDIR